MFASVSHSGPLHHFLQFSRSSADMSRISTSAGFSSEGTYAILAGRHLSLTSLTLNMYISVSYFSLRQPSQGWSVVVPQKQFFVI